ncbi:MAG: hypothetical protein HMLIMOIP_002555 [Candidatus Nitrosomirales archaeon]|jgi:hypothetical protein
MKTGKAMCGTAVIMSLMLLLSGVIVFAQAQLDLNFLQPHAISDGKKSFAIKKISSGLVASDPLTKSKSTLQLKADKYWDFNGNAKAQKAEVSYFQKAEGLHIGVKAVSKGVYAGFFAVTPPTKAYLFHADITTPHRIIRSDFFQNGLYVQTASGLVNYVTCVAITSRAGTSWHVMQATGNFNQTTSVKTLWSDKSANQELNRDCTIITNGSNYLKVYLDNVLVYENSQLKLQMQPPFRAFLEPQNSHQKPLFGIYKDFYIALDEKIKVVNVPSNAATVKLVDRLGKALASTPVKNGIANLNVGQYHFPLLAHIKVYDNSNAEIASTTAPASIVGGDVYSVNRT